MPCGCGYIPPPAVGGVPKRARTNSTNSMNSAKTTIMNGNANGNASGNAQMQPASVRRPRTRTAVPQSTRTTRITKANQSVDDTMNLAIELAPLVFDDYGNDPEKLRTLIAASMTGVTNKKIMDLFVKTSIAIRVFTMDHMTGAHNNEACIAYIDMRPSPLKMSSNTSPDMLHLANCEFVVSVTTGGVTKDTRVSNYRIKKEISEGKNSSELLLRIVKALGKSPSPLERYMYFWFVMKNFIAPETIVNIRIKDFSKTAVVANANVKSMFEDMQDNKSALTLAPKGIFRTPSQSLQLLKTANPNAKANKHDMQVNALMNQMQKVMTNVKHERLPSNATVAKDIKNFKEAMGTLAPRGYNVRWATPVVSTTKGGQKKK